MPFKAFNLCSGIEKAIQEAGYAHPTSIQLKVIPQVLKRFDLQVSAPTGSGKTAAFILPILHLLNFSRGHPPKGPRVLILTPTRELARQVDAEATKFSKYLPQINTACIYGGVSYSIQNRQLLKSYDLLVATPGRLIDHLQNQSISLSQVEVLILDEADKMLEMGFIKPVEQIIARCSSTKRQTLLFSATMTSEVINLSKKLMRKPLLIQAGSPHSKYENIEQRLYYVDHLSPKHELLEQLLYDPSITQVIIFTSTKRSVDELVENLRGKGFSAAGLHGDMPQMQRTKTVAKMHAEEIRILVATDVAARGLDISTISHVINFDLPSDAESYIHRIGRTGRAGLKGTALSFATVKDKAIISQIEQWIGYPLSISN